MTKSGFADRICPAFAVQESSTKTTSCASTAGQISAHHLVQATTRSSTLSLSRIEVTDGCRETTRCGLKSPSWEKTSIILERIYNLPMALSINDPEVEALARELAEKTGENMDQAFSESIRGRLRALTRGDKKRLAEELNEIALRFAALPSYDNRP